MGGQGLKPVQATSAHGVGRLSAPRPHLLVVRASFATLGGAERELVQLLQALRSRWDVTLATLDLPDDAADVLGVEGLRVLRPATPWRLKGGLIEEVLDRGHAAATRAWASLNVPWPSVDAVHISVCRGSLDVLPLVPEHLPVHYNCLEPPRWLHEDVLHRRVDGRPTRPLWLTRLAFSRQRRRDVRAVRDLLKRPLSLITGNSAYTAEQIQRVYRLDQPPLRDDGAPPARDAAGRPLQAGVLHPGIDLSCWPATATEDERADLQGLAVPERYVVTVGRASHVKGTWATIDALAGSGTDLVQVGGGAPEDMARLAEHATAFGVGFHPMPRLSQAALRGVYRGAVAVVSHAHGEPFGLTPMEALAVGVPPVVVADGGFVETVSGFDPQWLVPRGDAEAFRKALKRAEDPEFRDQVKRSGPSYVATTFAIEEEVRSLTALLDPLLASA
jgi:glycosyltransferase involved in cell wall biosynthesis